MCKEFSSYCLQSLFIPPGWSPNVPCRHTNRCCIWRSPFSILYILPLTAVVMFTSQQQWPTKVKQIRTVVPVFVSYQKCQSRQIKSPKSINFFAAVREITCWGLSDHFVNVRKSVNMKTSIFVIWLFRANTPGSSQFPN